MITLGENDLFDIEEKLWDARSKWKNIGLGLKIRRPDLQVIDRNLHDDDDKFHGMILKWLQNGKDCTWTSLCEVLSRRSVGHGHLSEKLRQDEKECQPSQKPFALKKGIELRDYQEELAGPGLEGKNYIFVAPTGTGKTLVAGYIIMHHLNKMLQEGRMGKVAFVTPT